MEVIKCIKERRSIRKFKAEKVGHEVLAEIVDIAAYAPSWKNTQVARYTVVEDEAVKAKIAEEGVLGFEYNTKTINRAPQLVVVSYVNGRSGYEKDGSYSTPKGDKWETFDAGIATQTFCLAAHEKGVGSVILGYFDGEMIAKEIGLPEGQTVAVIIAIGYEDGDHPDAPARKTSEDLLSYK